MSPEERDRAREMYRHRTAALASDRGEGPVLVCAHGTLMDRTMFAPQFALADDYRVVAYDLRARTDNYHGPYDLDDLVGDCRATLDALGIDSCVLAGMSMGGFMALRFALEHPDRLDGLVLVDSMAEAHTDNERERYAEMIETIRAAGRAPDQLADTVSYLLFGETTREERPDLVEEWIGRWQTYPGEAVYGEVDSWLDRPDLTDRLDEIGIPTLVVHGEEDDAIGIERAERTVEGLLDARLVPVEGAGHSSNLERPEPVNEALREFLGEVYG